MSVALAIFASLALTSNPFEQVRDLDEGSMRFANTLVTAYTCDLLGYGVDYIALADLGYETQEAMMKQGATYDEAMNRIRADVRRTRDRFNSRYYTAIYRARFNVRAADDVTSPGQLQRFQRTFTSRCNALAEQEETAAFFTKPESRLSSADLSRKVRNLVVLARHGE